ncbi:hypothetical protein EC396_05560 [Lutibacter sp. HS1-25]|nr:hypothetical protein EC396_05560 [Lutibacter sp. HS1-25]
MLIKLCSSLNYKTRQQLGCCCSLSLYSVAVRNPVFQLTTSVFDKIKIKLENGKEFLIITNGQEKMVFISKKLN